MNKLRRYILPAAVALAVIAAALWNLDGANPWWDEGWTLSVARTWVEHGFYGRLLDGQLAPPGLEAAFPTTSLVALSLRLFGVGLWQGRLPIALCALAALGLVVWLARRLYDSRVAWASLFVLLLTPIHPLLNPLLVGRQVVAEMPMLALLLAGYACFLLTLSRSRWWLALALLFWALGVRSKLQAVPFWTISLLAPLALCLLQRRWRAAGWLATGLGGTAALAALLPSAQAALLAGHTLPPAALPDLLAVTAVVPALDVRLFALRTTLTDGLLALLGLAYAAWRFGWRERLRLDSPAAIVRCAWLAFAGSWLLWFVALSVGWERYLFPATFAASMFVAVLLRDLTGDFDLRGTLRQLGLAVGRRPGRQGLAGLAALLLIVATLPLALDGLRRAYLAEPDHSAMQAAAFLNSTTPANARIETYESELLFFLERAYHFPPDELHVALNRRMVLKLPEPVEYAPLAARPDVVVVGSFSRMWQLYDMLPQQPDFRLIRSYGMYEIYERIDR